MGLIFVEMACTEDVPEVYSINESEAVEKICSALLTQL